MIIADIAIIIVMTVLMSLELEYTYDYWLIYEFCFVMFFEVYSYTDIYLKLRNRHKFTLHRFWDVLSTKEISSLTDANR